MFEQGLPDSCEPRLTRHVKEVPHYLEVIASVRSSHTDDFIINYTKIPTNICRKTKKLVFVIEINSNFNPAGTLPDHLLQFLWSDICHIIEYKNASNASAASPVGFHELLAKITSPNAKVFGYACCKNRFLAAFVLMTYEFVVTGSRDNHLPLSPVC